MYDSTGTTVVRYIRVGVQDVGGSGWLGGRSIRGEEGGLVMRKEGGWVGTDVGSGLPGNRGVGMSWRSVPTHPLLCFQLGSTLPPCTCSSLPCLPYLSHDASQFTHF